MKINDSGRIIRIIKIGWGDEWQNNTCIIGNSTVYNFEFNGTEYQDLVQNIIKVDTFFRK